MNVTTPSGLSGVVRKLRGSEANALANKRLAAKSKVFEEVLSGIWVETIDAGPYGFETTSRPPWDRILVCDRFYALVAARIATYGPAYSFPAECGGSRGCGHRFEWDLNLETDVPVYDLPDDSRAAIADKRNEFASTLDGKAVVFRLLDGRAEREVADDFNASEIVTRNIASRLVRVEGLKGRGKFFREEVNEWLKGVSMDEQTRLFDEMEERDGGFETDLDIECPRCSRIFETSIPFEGSAFWMPRSKKRDSKRQARTMTGAVMEDGPASDSLTKSGESSDD